jgi:autophagy-related protein 18
VAKILNKKMTEQKKKNEILYLSFNKDKTCLSLGMKTGYRIYDLTKKDSLFFYERILGKSIGIIEMLEKTNILGLVGGSEEHLSPKILNIYDDNKGENIAEIKFKSTILHVRLRKDIILVILENLIYLIDTLEFKAFDAIELGYQKQKNVVFSFTLEPEVKYLAYNYTNQQKNEIKINSYDKENERNQIELKTKYFNNPILCMEFDKEGKILAVSAKNNDYLLIYRVDDGIPVCKCHLNSNSLNSLCISFEKNNDFLCVSLDDGEIVIFNIKSLNEGLKEFNQNSKLIKEEIWSKFYLPEKKAICTFTGYEIGVDHIICIGTKGNYYLVKFNCLQKESLALKISEKYILRPEN